MTGQNTQNGENSGFINVDGINLHYIIEGKGIQCLVISMPSNFG